VARSDTANARDSVAIAAFGEDGRQVLTLSTDGSLRVWDTESGDLLVEPPAATVNVQIAVTAAGFSQDRSRVVVVLGSVYAYGCPVCRSTPRVLQQSRDHVSPYVARNAPSLSLQ
jgi:WD40 repeat protein